ncbi:NAC domain containing protein 63 [Striga asiatica]|uniref:NAC domain containing protein 63 n=1 Tax=Striga asiatica TaxID=4170 RepID=A0A5A7QAQ9_STRAF|nr:NAC domain containing protein 63 [Striga asiatica]
MNVENCTGHVLIKHEAYVHMYYVFIYTIYVHKFYVISYNLVKSGDKLGPVHTYFIISSENLHDQLIVVDTGALGVSSCRAVGIGGRRRQRDSRRRRHDRRGLLRWSAL